MKGRRRLKTPRKSIAYARRLKLKSPPNDLLDTDISFDLERLFDEYNLDHIPVSKRLDLFQKRNLRETKYFKEATKLFFSPLKHISRERIIIAPPMETLVRHRVGFYLNKPEYPPAPQMTVHIPRYTILDDTADFQNCALNKEANKQGNRAKGEEKEVDKEHVEAEEEHKITDEETELEKSYRQWLEKRKKFRADLDGVGLNAEWLQRKPDKTELEKRVLKRMMMTEPKSQSPNVDLFPSPSISPTRTQTPSSAEGRPRARTPDMFTSPWGIRILERHLRKNKMRLIDLFTCVDKDKNWKLSRSEFRASLKQSNVPLSDALIEDLVLSLDVNYDDNLDYKELRTGMDIWRKEKREYKKMLLERERKARSKSGSPRAKNAQERASTRDRDQNQKDVLQTKEDQQQQRASSGKESDSSRSSTPQCIYEVPSLLNNVEKAGSAKRKMNRVVKTGNRAIDNHNLASTMTRETARNVEKLRQLKLKEFLEINRLCHSRNIPLNAKLLERALLHPPEKPSKILKAKLALPEEALLSRHFADPPKEPPLPIEVKHKHKIIRSDSGKLLIDTRHRYPLRANVAPILSKVNLPTGRSVIGRRIDCWMTFEEYENLTSHLAVRYKHLYGSKDDNAFFWPGHLLEKIRLCMPPYDKPEIMDKKTVLFQRKKDDRIYHPDYKSRENSAWPIGDNGYFVSGMYDKYARKQLPGPRHTCTPKK